MIAPDAMIRNLTSERRTLGLPLAALLLIAAGGALQLAGAPAAGDALWAATVALMLVPLTVSIVRTLAAGRVGVDAIALVAMAGALAVGQYLAGAVIALMLSGGNALEASASRRARRELTALLERMPTVAHRRAAGGWEEVPVAELAIGDEVLVRAGELVPVDGKILGREAAIDESALTGEPLPVTRPRGATVRSGSANAGEAFELRASRRAADSAYAGIVRLVRAAETQRAPFVRLADRYAAFFLPLTLVVSAAAWIASGDPVRAVAVLVVATPCPLILAAPIAIVSGVSRAARAGVIVKGGGAIERLGEARTVLLDKTGTLTLGRPAVGEVVAFGFEGGEGEALRLAASVDQLSAHVLAEALVHDAERRGLRLAEPLDPVERPGEGIEATVEGRRVAVGSESWLRSRGYDTAAAAAIGAAGEEAGLAKVLVGVDGELAAVVVMADRLREDAGALAARLRAAGVRRVAMVTGDRRSVAERIAAETGLDRVFAEQSPRAEARRRARGARRSRPGPGRHGRRRRQRRARPGARRRRHRDQRSGGDDLLRDRRRRDHGRPDRAGRRRGRDRPPLARHRPPERRLRDRPEHGRDGLRRARLHPAAGRRPAPGGHRRRGDPQRPAGAARLSAIRP